MINVNVSQPNDGLGDKLRDAFIIVNDNFNELFSLIDGSVNQSELDSAIDSINTQINNIVTNINTDLTNILNILDTKSDIGHTHLISEISGLQTILNSLVTSTTFNTQITSINSQIASINDILLDLQNQIDNILALTSEVSSMNLQQVTNIGATTSTLVYLNGGMKSEYNNNYIDFRPDFDYSEIFFDSGFSNTLFSNSSSKISMEAYKSDYSEGSNLEVAWYNIDLGISGLTTSSNLKIVDDQISLQSNSIRLIDNNNKSAILSTSGYVGSGEYTFKFPEQSGTFSLTSHTHSYTEIVGLSTQLALKANDNSVVHLYGDESIDDLKTFLNNCYFNKIINIKDNNDKYAQLYAQDDRLVIDYEGSNISTITRGSIRLYNTSDFVANIENFGLTTDRTYNLPDSSGTFSLTSHTHSYTEIVGLTSSLNTKIDKYTGASYSAHSLWTGSQAQYDALSPTYSTSTLYFII